jgi:sec-independent protein translocase protein TatB
MFDVGWTELLVIAVVLIVVVGPKDLPPMLRAFGKMTARMRKVAGEFRSQFDEALREAELDDVRRTIDDAQKLNPVNTLREAMNPLREMGNEIKADLQRATTVETKTEVAATPAVSAPEPSMSLPETPPVVPPPAPVIAPPTNVSEPPVASVQPASVAAEPAAAVAEKPKPARKPRAKTAASATTSPVAVDVVEKPKRAGSKTSTATKKTMAAKKKDKA